jgi:hypothetical protein
MDAIAIHTTLVIPVQRQRPDDTYESRLRRQLHADALQPLTSIDDDTNIHAAKKSVEASHNFSSDVLEETGHFLRLQVR